MAVQQRRWRNLLERLPVVGPVLAERRIARLMRPLPDPTVPVGPGAPVQFRMAESAAFGHHVTTTEAARPTLIKKSGKGANVAAQSFSLAWDEHDALRLPSASRGAGNLTDRQRKQAYYDAYKLNPWISACIDRTAQRITSGGMTIIPTGKDSQQANHDTLQTLFNRINNYEDFSHWLASIIVDRRIFGEAFVEIVYDSSGKPAQLHKIDCLTMSYKLDPHGNVEEYIQELENSNKRQSFDPKQIIRFWDKDPRAGHTALSPIERIMQAHYSYLCMIEWQQNFFKKGAKPSLHLHFASEMDAKRHLEFLIENATGLQNAHAPAITWGSGTLAALAKGSIEVDFEHGIAMARNEIIAGFGCYPAIVGLIEAGNIGGGTGESQDKAFMFNTCEPIKQDTLEKINWHVADQGFGIKDWKVATRYADYRSDLDVVKVQDTRIRNASRTVDEVRQEEGKDPYGKENGGATPIFTTTKEIIPLARLTDLEGEQREQADLGIQAQQAAVDVAKVQADKAKNPDPVPPALANVAGGQPPLPTGTKTPDGAPLPPKPNAKPKDGEPQESFLDLVTRLTLEKEVRERFSIAESHPDFQTVFALWKPFREQHARQIAESLITWRDEQIPMEDIHHEESLHSLSRDRRDTRSSVAEADTKAVVQPTSPTQSSTGDPFNAATDTSQSSAAAGALRESPESPDETGRGVDLTTAGGRAPVSQYDSSVKEAEAHTGMMLAFLLDSDTANQLAIPGGESASELHLTLGYLGDTEDEITSAELRPNTSPAKIKDAITAVASHAQTLYGRITGFGRFQPAETDTNPVVALIDMPGLAELRTDLVNAIQAAGYFVAQNHDFVPHCTLAYIAPDATMPITSVPDLPLAFDTVCLVIGDDRTYFPLQGNTQESAKATPVIWEPDDIEDILKGVLDEGYVTGTWKCDGTACAEICWPNNGQTVSVGQPYKSGHRINPAHPECNCTIKYHKEQPAT